MQDLITATKDHLDTPAGPELFEASNFPASGLFAGVAQIVKMKGVSSNVEPKWQQVEDAVKSSVAKDEAPHFFHGNGVEKWEGMFVGIIGWKDLEVSFSHCDDCKCT